MRVRWRDLELPLRVVSRQNLATDYYGEFVAEPFERGFGRTIGNSLRRVLLSAIEGCAVTSVKIEGIKHEFSSIPNVMEDVSDIIINVKKLRIKMDPDVEGSITLSIDVKKEGIITAADIDTQGKAIVINKDLRIATLTEESEFKMEMEAKRGRGYVTAEENLKEPQEIGVIPIASIFSPVYHVQYWTENTRVGKITNYDRLILAIKTDGTISPDMALVEASKILRKHLNPFVQYFELGEEVPQEEGEKKEEPYEEDQNKQKLLEKLMLPVETLGLGVRSSNCLSSAGIHYIKDLVKCSEGDLLKIRNFGKTSLNEIREKLKKLDLELGIAIEPEHSSKKEA